MAAKAYGRNNQTRRQMREAIKAFTKTLDAGKTAEIAKLQSQAYSTIDIAAKKNVIHKNKAAHLKSKLASQAKSKGVKPAKSLKPKTKSSTKPKVAKKPTAKNAEKTSSKKT